MRGPHTQYISKLGAYCLITRKNAGIWALPRPKYAGMLQGPPLNLGLGRKSRLPFFISVSAEGFFHYPKPEIRNFRLPTSREVRNRIEYQNHTIEIHPQALIIPQFVSRIEQASSSKA